jgi:hypothetical protein
VIRVSLNNEIHLLFLTLLSDKDKVVPAAAVEPPPQRKRLVLQPRTTPMEVTTPAAESESSHSEEETNIEMTEEAALKKISEDLKEFFAVRNLEEAEVYFSSLPAQHHHSLVDKIVSTAVESKEDDAKLVSQFFALAASKELCSAASFKEGLTPVAEAIDDIAIDAPKAFQLLAMMVKGAGLNQEQLAMQYMLQVGHWSYLITIPNFISHRICSSSVNVGGLHIMLLLPLLPLHKFTRK